MSSLFKPAMSPHRTFHALTLKSARREEGEQAITKDPPTNQKQTPAVGQPSEGTTGLHRGMCLHMVSLPKCQGPTLLRNRGVNTHTWTEANLKLQHKPLSVPFVVWVACCLRLIGFGIWRQYLNLLCSQQ